MAEHDTDPHHYLSYVHDFDLTRLDDAPPLGAMIKALPGRKIIFTNADASYAHKVLARLHLSDVFEEIVDIHDTAYRPKPEPEAYQTLRAKTGIDPTRSLFVEDMARNLAPAKAMGMATVWINNDSDLGSHGHDPALIDHQSDTIHQWLSEIVPLVSA